MQQIRCSEVWGGIKNADLDVGTAGLTATLFSGAADGGKGGDIYYFTVCDEDMLTRIAVADVQGHGEAVSRMSESLYKVLAERMNGIEGDGVLSDLNREACRYGLDALATAVVVAFYKADSSLYFSYAGHPPILIRRRAKRRWQEALVESSDKAANLPLGVAADSPFEQAQMPLTPGDRIFMYTDGLIEAPGPRGELFGEQRLRAVLDEAAGRALTELKGAVLQAVRQHTGGALTHDDVTLMALEVR